MNGIAWAFLAMLVLAIAGLLVVACKYYFYRKKINQLAKQIQGFLHAPYEAMPFSVQDNATAQIENAVAELEGLVILKHRLKEKTIKEESDFIADISHQLKNPLAGLKLFCEMDNGAHREKQLALIAHMEKLIYSLLRLEKLRAGGYEMNFEDYDLRVIVSEVCDGLRPMHTAKNIAVYGDAMLRCDQAWISEAFSNIIKNACEHAKENVTIDVERTAGNVFVNIQDDGGGVPDAQLSLLFRRFSLVSTKMGGGTGLGLAISRAIVEKHHGLVMARNAACGLQIMLSFPVIEAVRTI